WQGMIPDSETPFQYNPERGFVSSANQRPVDSTYPYYLGREYPTPRGAIINRMLADTNKFTPERMMKMQTDNYNIFAEWARPIFLKNIDASNLSKDEQRYFELLSKWDLRNDPQSTGATVFVLLWKNLKPVVFDDEYANAPQPILLPFESTLLESILGDTAWKFIDNINTPQKETLADICLLALKNAGKELKEAETGGRLEWARYKDTRINHLTKLDAFSSLHVPIGGGDNIINAARSDHGPSWRMVVSLTQKTEAYGIYPGGQNGNPGSRYYNNFVQDWSVGKYYPLWMMTRSETSDKRIKWKMNFSKG
ncbi:MAG: penicillin acylase family protein, partial [Sphingobacteriales bacterium]